MLVCMEIYAACFFAWGFSEYLAIFFNKFILKNFHKCRKYLEISKLYIFGKIIFLTWMECRWEAKNKIETISK